MVMLTGSAVHARLATALTEPVNITHRPTYHRQEPARDRRVQTPSTPSTGMSPFLFEATHSRLDVLNAVQTSTWSTILSDAAAAQGRQLARATWVLAAATIGLVVATVVLILVTAQA